MQYIFYFRVHELTGEKQLLVRDIQHNLKKNLPKKTYCSVGITWTDLYPLNYNFVLGEAHMALNSGVLSFGRFEPKLYREGNPPPPIEKFDGNLVWKMIKVLSHETCHIFGLNHCMYFSCAMNESSCIEEAMAQPLFLCPVCLRKLHKVCKFNVTDRYKQLLQFLLNVNTGYSDCERFAESIHWLKKCLTTLENETTYL